MARSFLRKSITQKSIYYSILIKYTNENLLLSVSFFLLKKYESEESCKWFSNSWIECKRIHGEDINGFVGA
jgi:hypothetical protein